MATVVRALRGNAHALNYAILAGATLVPILVYANMRSPTQEQVEATLVRTNRPTRGRDTRCVHRRRQRSHGTCRRPL